jgi:RNA polymerase sigma-70 factor (ECF subfamily)
VSDLEGALTSIHREEYAAVVASLVGRFGDLDLAEDAASEAIVAALEHWPDVGIPPNPGGWLTTTATRRAIDRIRRESHRDTKHQQAAMIIDPTPPADPGVVDDDRLRLLFTCCHPALAPEARVALTLKLVGGLTVEEIAAAFLVPGTTMAQRITRAKRKITQARIPYRLPQAADLPARLGAVLSVVYLIFNEGYLSSSGTDPIREDLCREAIRLARLLRSLIANEPEITGLLALMLLTDARRPARVAGGELVTLGEQDRGRWDRELIEEGHALVRECLAINEPGHYQLLAAINAVHTDAPTASATDWGQIAALYDQLHVVAPTPVVALNRAVARAEVDGPLAALASVDRLALSTYHAWHATRADLLRRLGRSTEAAAAYDEAILATGNPAERAYLTRRRGELG